MTLRVGHASVRLDVCTGARMAGYVARRGGVTGVLHPLEVGAAALVGDSSTAVLCVADLLHVDDDLAVATRTAVAAAVGTTPDLVWLCATHTHAGPEPRDVGEQVAAAAVSAATEAVAGATPAQVTRHRAELDGVGGQRTGAIRRTSVPVDILRVGDPDGTLRGLLGVVPVHPTVLGADNTAVSPDLPGAVRRAVGTDVWSLVATGAAGDVSTRAHRRSQDPDEVERLGGLAADALLRAARQPPDAEATDVVGGRVESVGLAPALPEAPFRAGALVAARRVLARAQHSGDPAAVRDATVAWRARAGRVVRRLGTGALRHGVPRPRRLPPARARRRALPRPGAGRARPSSSATRTATPATCPPGPPSPPPPPPPTTRRTRSSSPASPPASPSAPSP